MKKTLKVGGTVMVLSLIISLNNESFGQDRPEGRHQGPPTFSQLLTEMDENKDGKLSEFEVKGPLKEDFLKIDTDEDGFISETEFDNAPKPEGGNRPKRR